MSFLDIFYANGLYPTITKPTRITHASATLIDNIYTNVNQFHTAKAGILTIDLSDHLPVLALIGKQKQMQDVEQDFTFRPNLERKIKDINEYLQSTNWDILETSHLMRDMIIYITGLMKLQICMPQFKNKKYKRLTLLGKNG